MERITPRQFIERLRELKRKVDKGTKDILDYVRMSAYLNALYRLGLPITMVVEGDETKVSELINDILRRIGGEIRIDSDTVLISVSEPIEQKPQSVENEDKEAEKINPEKLVKETEKIAKAVDEHTAESIVEIAQRIEEERHEIRKYIEQKPIEIEIRKSGKKFDLQLSFGAKNKLIINIPNDIDIVFHPSVHPDIERYLTDRNIRITTFVEAQSKQTEITSEKHDEAIKPQETTYSISDSHFDSTVDTHQSSHDERVSRSDTLHSDAVSGKEKKTKRRVSTKVRKQTTQECSIQKSGVIEKLVIPALEKNGEIEFSEGKKKIRITKKDVDLLFYPYKFYEKRTGHEYETLYELIICRFLQNYNKVRNFITNVKTILLSAPDEMSDEEKQYIKAHFKDLFRLALLEYLGENPSPEKLSNLSEEEAKSETDFIKKLIEYLKSS